jgi:hypothetical protein
MSLKDGKYKSDVKFNYNSIWKISTIKNKKKKIIASFQWS